MSQFDNIEPRYQNVQAALSDLANLSRMLEVTRGCHARVAVVYDDLDRLAAKLVADRKEALRAIDALTETAPTTCGVEVSPYVEWSGAHMQSEVTEIEKVAADIIAGCGGVG